MKLSAAESRVEKAAVILDTAFDFDCNLRW